MSCPVLSCLPRLSSSLHRTRQAVGAALSPCMRYVASGSEDGLAYLFDLRTGTFADRLGGSTCTSDVVSVSFLSFLSLFSFSLFLFNLFLAF